MCVERRATHFAAGQRRTEEIDMDRHHGHTLPGLAAAATGTALGAAFVSVCGLNADLAASPGALAMAIAAFVAPGIAGALATAWQARRPSRFAAARAVATTVAPAIAPFAPAEAVADIRSLTEERVVRARRGARRARDVTALAS
jgi:hypothetical protein